MKIIRNIATALVLCGAAFFTNMSYAGDCGEWKTGGYYQSYSVGSGGTLGPATATGQFWVNTVEWVPAACPEPIIPTGELSLVNCARQQAICTRACEKNEKQAVALCGIANIIPYLGSAANAVCVYLAIEAGSKCLDICQNGADLCDKLNNKS